MAAGVLEAAAIEVAKQGDGQRVDFFYGLHKSRVEPLCFRADGKLP